MARRTFPPSSYDERRVKKREKKMRGGGRDPDESERRGGMGGRLFLFCLLEFSQRRNVELCVTPLAPSQKSEKIKQCVWSKDEDVQHEHTCRIFTAA